MRPFLLIWGRELLAFFLSPIAYVVGIFFLIVMGYSFWMLASLLTDGPAGISVMGELFGSLFFWMPMLIVCPVITMRLLAEEKRSGTMETLLTAPVGEGAVVAGKYAAAFTFYLTLWLPTLVYALVLRRFSAESAPLDPGTLLGGYIGAAVVGALYLAVGVFCSSLTSNQVVAAMAAFAFLAVLFFTGFLGDVTHHEGLRRLFNHISSVKHMQDYARGVVDTRSLVFHLGGAAFLLFAAARMLEARRWK